LPDPAARDASHRCAPQGAQAHVQLSGASVQARRTLSFWPRSSTLIESPSPIESTVAADAAWANGAKAATVMASRESIALEAFRITGIWGTAGKSCLGNRLLPA